VPEWLTPPQVARERGLKPAKVLAWIASGELEAVNHAGSTAGRPRWRINPKALEAFDRARSNRAPAPARAAPAPRRAEPKGVFQYF